MLDNWPKRSRPTNNWNNHFITSVNFFSLIGLVSRDSANKFAEDPELTITPYLTPI